MSGRPPRFLGNPRNTFPRNVRPAMYPRAFTANPRGMYFPQPTAATSQQTFYDHQQFVQSDYRQQQQQQNVIYVTAQENQHQQQVVVLPQDGQQMYEVVPSSQADEFAQDQQYIQVLSEQTEGNVIQYAQQPVQQIVQPVHHFIQPAHQNCQQLAPQGQQQAPVPTTPAASYSKAFNTKLSLNNLLLLANNKAFRYKYCNKRFNIKLLLKT